MVENCDIKLEILNKSTNLNQSGTQINVMSELFFCEGFSLGHVIITTIIINQEGQYDAGCSEEMTTNSMCSDVVKALSSKSYVHFTIHSGYKGPLCSNLCKAI